MFPVRRLARAGLLLSLGLIAAACGSSGDAATTTTAAPTTTSTTTVSTSTSAPTTTTLPPLEATCEDGAQGSEATVVGVVDYVRIRAEATTASDEIGRLNLGATVTVFPADLTYDGSDYWWVPVRLPAAGTCGNVAAEFLADASGRLDQQIPGITFRPPSSGEWIFASRTALTDPIEATLEGAFLTSYSVMPSTGNRIDELLADQQAEFDEFEYDYPADWNRPVDVPGADRAVRLIPISSPSGDLTYDRLLIEVGEHTLEVSTAVYIEDFDKAPLTELNDFIDSVAIDPAAFLAAVTR